jgi:hypothetical protein
MRRLRKAIERNASWLIRAEKYVWSYMIYGCKDCGYKTRMFLEKGLEEHGENHKPVPFMIQCPKCHNFHCYDISGLIKLPAPRPLKSRENYFKNDDKHDCGVPVTHQVCKKVWVYHSVHIDDP